MKVSATDSTLDFWISQQKDHSEKQKEDRYVTKINQQCYTIREDEDTDAFNKILSLPMRSNNKQENAIFQHTLHRAK
jgi:hypothetical protein